MINEGGKLFLFKLKLNMKRFFSEDCAYEQQHKIHKCTNNMERKTSVFIPILQNFGDMLKLCLNFIFVANFHTFNKSINFKIVASKKKFSLFNILKISWIWPLFVMFYKSMNFITRVFTFGD